MGRRWLWPLVTVAILGTAAALVTLLAVGLKLSPRDVPSPLINQNAPAFRLPQLDNPQVNFSPEDLRGQVWMLNVWASWCVSCLAEHPVLLNLAQTGRVRLYGLNYKDKPEAALAWLRRHGNPYVQSMSDIDGLVGIDFGVYGVPETYVIDKAGVIRHKHTGPITPQALADVLLPLVEKLNAL